MKEIINSGNIFLLPRAGKNDAVCVTTNGIIRRDGKAVMGAGIAKYARDNFAGVDRILASKLTAQGNHAFNLGTYLIPALSDNRIGFVLLSFPTKNDWRDDSSLDLIRQSCREIKVLARQLALDMVYLPCPGCANGHLDYWRDVRPILLEELKEDLFVVSVPDHIMRKKV